MPDAATPTQVRRRPTEVTRRSRVEGADAARLWELYHEAFAPLQELALLNHLYAEETFLALLADPRVTKLVGWKGGRPVGLAMVTNVLEVVPQISPAFLRRRYPEEAARSAVYFGILVFVDAGSRCRTLYPRLAGGMAQVAADDGGVILFDVCEHNRVGESVERQLRTITGWFPSGSFERVDAQSYYAMSLPHPAERRRTAVSVDLNVDLSEAARRPDARPVAPDRVLLPS